ncbi:MAG: hypothetical protein J6B77_09725 [Clostridia bacterium]|nr:hypothetical protein [Clostridia bacterium]
MTSIDPNLLIAAAVIVLAIVGFAALMIRSYKRAGKNAAAEEAYVEERLKETPETVTVHARVVDQCCFTTTVGIKAPKAVKAFFVSFAGDDGMLYKIPVSEEMYDAFEIGQVGELTLINGEVGSYILDEA